MSGQCNSAGTDTVCRCTCVAVVRQWSIVRCCACRPAGKCITCSWRNRQGERCAVSNIYCGNTSGRFLLRRCGCWKRNIAVWSIVVCLAVGKWTDCRLICAVGIEIDYDRIFIQFPLSIERNVPCRHCGWGCKLSAVAIAVWRIFALIPAVECIALASYCCKRILSYFIGNGIKLLIERIFLAVAAWFTSVIHRIGEITDADIRKLYSYPFGSWTETQPCVRPALRNGIISRHSAGCRSRRSNSDIIICTCAAISVLRAPWRWWSWCIGEYIAVQARRLINGIAIWNFISMTRNKSHVAGFGRSIILTRRSKVIGISVGSLLWCELNWIFMLIYCNRRICVSHRRVRHAEFEIIKVKLILIHEFIFIDSPVSIKRLSGIIQIPVTVKQTVTYIYFCAAISLSIPAVEGIACTGGSRKLLNKSVILNIIRKNVVIFRTARRHNRAVTLQLYTRFKREIIKRHVLVIAMPDPEANTGNLVSHFLSDCYIGFFNSSGCSWIWFNIKELSRVYVICVLFGKLHNQTTVCHAAACDEVAEVICFSRLELHRNKTDSIFSGKRAVSFERTVVKLFKGKAASRWIWRCWIMCESLLDYRIKHILGETVMILVKAKVYWVVFPLSRKCYILEELPVDICTRLINQTVGAALPAHEGTARTCRIGRGCTADLSDYVLWLEQHGRWGQARCSVICAAVGVIIYAVGVGCVPEFPCDSRSVRIWNIIVVIICAILKNTACFCCWAISNRVITFCKSGDFIIITVNSVTISIALWFGIRADYSRTHVTVIVSRRTAAQMNSSGCTCSGNKISCVYSWIYSCSRRMLKVNSHCKNRILIFVKSCGIPVLLLWKGDCFIVSASQGTFVDNSYIHRNNINIVWLWPSVVGFSSYTKTSGTKNFNRCWRCNTFIPCVIIYHSRITVLSVDSYSVIILILCQRRNVCSSVSACIASSVIYIPVARAVSRRRIKR